MPNYQCIINFIIKKASYDRIIQQFGKFIPMTKTRITCLLGNKIDNTLMIMHDLLKAK